jgi:hypothetical protein
MNKNDLYEDVMKYEYFIGWHRYYGKPLEPLTTSEAQRRDSEGKQYCVVVKDVAGDYEAFIEIGNAYYAVNFINDRRRVHLVHGFEDIGDGRVFLNHAILFDYRGGDKPYETTSYFFKQDGSLAIRSALLASNKATVKEVTCDVSGNWDTRPKFGEYENLLKMDR